jgi:uncharacterized protein
VLIAPNSSRRRPWAGPNFLRRLCRTRQPGHAPRKVIGSVNAAEFFITVAVATTFFIELATAYVEHIAALIIGGLLAAPFAGYIVRYVQPRALMAAVGVLVSSLALFQLAKSFG